MPTTYLGARFLRLKRIAWDAQKNVMSGVPRGSGPGLPPRGRRWCKVTCRGEGGDCGRHGHQQGPSSHRHNDGQLVGVRHWLTGPDGDDQRLFQSEWR